ncbi:MAG: prenyltransferase [Candidatus Bathyarchaeota archaeon]|nr:MAG: prenyltransferase [Candidatus Bathyarchaeota archaeon]
MGAQVSLRTLAVGLWRMSRPLPLLSAILAWLLGISIAFGTIKTLEMTSLVWGLAAMLLVSLSIHYANEFADHVTDSLTTRTIYSGGSGVITEGIVPRKIAIQAALTTLTAGFLVQTVAILTGHHPWSAMAILVIGAAGGWMYSMPPLRLAWRGLGEATNALLGGMMLPLHACTTLMGCLDLRVPLACLPFTLLCFNNLLAVTWPDRKADAQAGKMTLATRWRLGSLRRLHNIVGVISFVALLLLVGTIIPITVVVMSLAALPLMVWGGLAYTRREIATGTIYAMAVMMLAQSAAWLMVGLGV